MSSMGLDSKMSAEMGLRAFTALLRCFEESTSVSVPPTRLAIMRAPGPAPLVRMPCTTAVRMPGHSAFATPLQP